MGGVTTKAMAVRLMAEDNIGAEIKKKNKNLTRIREEKIREREKEEKTGGEERSNWAVPTSERRDDGT